jgi:hypothetical protein
MEMVFMILVNNLQTWMMMESGMMLKSLQTWMVMGSGMMLKSLMI